MVGILEGVGNIAFLAKTLSGSNVYTDDMREGAIENIDMLGYDNEFIYVMDSTGYVIADTQKEYVGKQMSKNLMDCLSKEITDSSQNQSGTIRFKDETGKGSG